MIAATLKTQIVTLSTADLRQLVGVVMSELRDRAKGTTVAKADEVPAPAVKTPALDTKTDPLTPKADKVERPWGIKCSETNKILKRRYASQAEALACISALVAQTNMTYNVTLIG